MNSSVEKDIQRLATFPEQNPNPVIEGNKETGALTYINPAAKNRFPDLEILNGEHPLLSEVIKRLREDKDFNCEIQLGDAYFEQKVFFIPDSNLVRIYSTDITEQKQIQRKLSRLASFPEQNPTPIIEFDINGNMTYLNPAFTAAFGSFHLLTSEHPALSSFYRNHQLILNKTISSFETEIHLNGKYYIQRGKWLAENEVVRVFTFDVTEQKQQEEIIREKNKDITDSINYARKIQYAMMPAENEFLSYFLDSFIYYQPKDIISGDFYWFTAVDDYRIFACADCTGHGVPGALMSMIGINSLEHIVKDKNISSPDAALLELDHRVRTALKQDEDNEQKDGMDIALCAFHTQKLILHYGAANRPMVLIRNNELQEIAPTKFAIGGPFNPLKKFEFHTLQLQKDDVLYFFTDGYTDQFGGPKGKKLTKKRFLELIFSIHKEPMALQKFKLKEFLHQWRGALEQVDDVCVIGIRI